MPKLGLAEKIFRIYCVKLFLSGWNLWVQPLWNRKDSASHCRQKDLMQKSNGGKAADERFLFHGTSKKDIEAICQQNFDWRICGLHGTVYGKGDFSALSIILGLLKNYQYSLQRAKVYKVVLGQSWASLCCDVGNRSEFHKGHLELRHSGRPWPLLS